MAKRTVRKAVRNVSAMGPAIAAVSAAAGHPEGNQLAAIFASIRTGETPWSLDELPAETGATEVLLSELDRLWQNPLPN